MVLGLAWAWAGTVQALGGVSVELDAVAGKGWSSGPLSVRIEPRGRQGFGFNLDARRLQLPPPLETLTRLRVQCAQGRESQGSLRCDKATITPYFGTRPGTPLVLALDYTQSSGRLSVDAPQLEIAGGRVAIDLVIDAMGGRGTVSAQEIELPQLAAFVALLKPDLPWADFEFGAGRLNLETDFNLDSFDPLSGEGFTLRLDIRGLEFSDRQGLQAGEGVGLALTVKTDSRNGGWRFSIESAIREGTLYLDPLLIEATNGTRELSAQGQWFPGRAVDISRFSFRHPGVVQLSGSGRWRVGPTPGLDALQVLLPQTPLAPIYRYYLKAFTEAGALSDLLIEGRLGLALDWRAAGGSVLDVQLNDLAVGDASGLFAVIGLQGDLRWQSAGAGPASKLRWGSAQVYRLDLGAGSMDLALRGRSLELLKPFELALLAGALEVPSLKATDLGLDSMALEMTAGVKSIDLAELGNTLAWVPLNGQLSGRIPALRYSNGRLDVDGAIDLSFFDGRARISNLSLEDPFGRVPRLGADIELRNLSLDLLSQSFSFGAIEGRLDGRINNLILDGWQPVAFDARFQTPPGDSSRHRISQRAVDNLASLGGANAVLSSTFLRFFNEFSYRQLGLSCRLQAGVCTMGGVAPAAQGYYIIQGGGLPPRVDVVGYNRRVDWQTLLGRLRAINQLDEVVIQ